MSKFPRSLSQAMIEYQIELENWVNKAKLYDIQDYFTAIHGVVFPDDWKDIVTHHMSSGRYGLEDIHSCQCIGCMELLLAIKTMALQRKELNALFISKPTIK